MTSARWLSALAAVLACVCAGCAGAGGEAARIDQSALAGVWGNPAGARLHLGADRSMTGESLNSAMLGGTQCPDTAAGHWLFFSTPDDTGSSFADDKFTSGDYIALPIDDPKASCLLSALIRRDEQGLNLCLVEDPDSDCSVKELLRREPATPPGRARN